jgi:hypothetical protein
LDNFTSKWDAPETSEPVIIKEDRSDKNGHSESIKLTSNDSRDEERRKLLREVEVRAYIRVHYNFFCLAENS